MKILSFPHPALSKPTTPWDFSKPDSKVELLFMAIDLQKTLDETPHGVALAANQVGLPHRLFVIKEDFADKNDIEPLIINPTYVGLLSGNNVEQEGCLSFPGTLLDVRRLNGILVGYQNIEGEQKSRTLTGFPARMFQHEIDHLDGKTFLDHTPRIERFRIMAELKKRKVAGLA